MGHGLVRFQIELPRKQPGQQQVARPAEVLDLLYQDFNVSAYWSRNALKFQHRFHWWTWDVKANDPFHI
jgi:hypothetical protein